MAVVIIAPPGIGLEVQGDMLTWTQAEIPLANRGVTGLAFEKGTIANDEEAMRATRSLARRLEELASNRQGDINQVQHNSLHPC